MSPSGSMISRTRWPDSVSLWLAVSVGNAAWLATVGWLGRGAGLASCSDQGCGAVQNSPLGRPLGISLAWWGTAACLAVLAFGIWRVSRGRPLFGSAVLLGASFVTAFVSAGATAYAAVVVRALCPDCLVACLGILSGSFLYGYGSLAPNPTNWRPGPCLFSMVAATLALVSFVGWNRASSLAQWETKAGVLIAQEVGDSGTICLGPPSAKTTWVAFIDFECGPCQEFLRQTYSGVWSGKLRLYLLNNPLSSHPLAAQLAEDAQAAWKAGEFASFLNPLLGFPPDGGYSDKGSRGTISSSSAIVARQKQIADALGIRTTPAVFEWTAGRVATPDWGILDRSSSP